jgi:hypothetical protein
MEARMIQPQSSFKLYSSAQPDDGADSDIHEIREAEARVREQEARVLRLIVQGAPTQTAEDLLRQLAATARAIRDRRLARG